ncbi:MAG: MlaD family protein [Pseudomonadota bacterium]
MKQISAGIKIGLLFLIVGGVGYYLWKSVDERAAGDEAYLLIAKLRDASGLPTKSRVVIAGLSVGEIGDRRLEGRVARLTIRVRHGIKIWSNAAVFKKSSSLLGEYYVEIDPGEEESPGPQGGTIKNRLLGNGDEITNVFEAATADELIRRVNETMPKVNEVMVEVQGLASDMRKLVKGPVNDMANTLSSTIKVDSELVHNILQRADRSMASIERITRDVGDVTGGSKQQVDAILDNVQETSVALRDLVATARQELGDTGASLRQKLDKVDSAVAALEKTFTYTASLARKVDENDGTLGQLVNDPALGENVTSISNDVASFVQTAFGLQTIVGLKTDYNYVAQAFRTTFSLELMPRPDKYYLVEIVDDPRGSPTETLSYAEDPDVEGEPRKLVRATSIDSALRFSFQFAKRIDPFVLRIGIKESTGGVGADVNLFDSRLTISTDVFDASFDRRPRLRLAVAYQFFRFLYVYGGVDDVLNPANTLPIDTGTISGQKNEYHFGRDVFGGVMLRFNDADLAALLFIGGSALGGMTK